MRYPATLRHKTKKFATAAHSIGWALAVLINRTFRRQPILFDVTPNLLTPNPRARRYTPEQTENWHKNTRQVTPWGVLPGGRNLPRFFLWIGTDYHRRTPYGIADGWEIVEMRGIEPRSDVASTGLLRAQFMRTLLFGSGTCINTYTDEPSHVKVPLTPATRASSSGLLSRCR